MNLVLITPARNEQALIENTLKSVCAQTRRPLRWIIVDDGSTDRTAAIVERYAEDHPWIELVRRPPHIDRSFAAKVQAFNAGFERTKSLDFEVIGNQDADISYEPDYLEFLLQRFGEDSSLGVAGTPFIENGYDSAKDSFEGENHVPGGCQLFRRQCFQDIGGYILHRAGGVDWAACTTARMKGWRTRSFSQKRFHHHRTLGTAERPVVSALFSYGEKDYYLGNSPVWQAFRITYRMTKKPMLIGGLAVLSGYCWAALRRIERPITPELVRFHRREQMKKLGAIFRSLLNSGRVDNFRLDNASKPIR